MGEIRVDVRLENEGDALLERRGKLGRKRVRSQQVDALVDTGAVMILLPQDLVERLGLETSDRLIVTLANDQRIELDVAGTLAVTIAGRTMKTDCLVGPPGCEPLIGQLVLERLDLVLDPLKRTVTVRPESPYLPSLKLK